jgi:hypothetical protein
MAMSQQKAISATVTGDDQKVGFRAMVMKQAIEYNLPGVAAVIRCTADPAKADKRTRSKWSRAMRYVVAYKPDSEALDRFVRRKGWQRNQPPLICIMSLPLRGRRLRASGGTVRDAISD